jgi:hypothetical protein
MIDYEVKCIELMNEIRDLKKEVDENLVKSDSIMKYRECENVDYFHAYALKSLSSKLNYIVDRFS